MELTFAIVFTLIVLGGRAIIASAITLFWLPYFLYLSTVIWIMIHTARFMLSRVSSQELGYSYKACCKIQKQLLKTEEFKTMKGVRYEKPHDYVCKCDEKLPEKEKTIFKVRYLTAAEQAEIRDLMYSVKGIGAARKEAFLTGSSSLKALEYGLQGWTNFVYTDGGEPIPFSVENFSCIPPAQRDELANHIRGIEEGEL